MWIRGEYVRTLVPTQKLLEEEELFPDMRRFYEKAYQFSSATNINENTRRKRMRSIRNAEAAVMMESCGLSVIPGNKPSLGKARDMQAAGYFTSRELSETLSQDMKYRALGRATGYITLPDGRVYQVFSLFTKNIEVRQVVEYETHAVAGGCFLEGERIGSAIVLGWKMNIMELIMQEDVPGPYIEGKRQTRMHLEPSLYKEQLFFPKSKDGMVNLMLLLLYGKDAIRKWVLGDAAAEEAFYDARYIEYGYVLCACTGDMIRIRRFMNAALDYPDERFTLVCFDYQEETLQAIIGDIPNITFSKPLSVRAVAEGVMKDYSPVIEDVDLMERLMLYVQRKKRVC